MKQISRMLFASLLLGTAMCFQVRAQQLTSEPGGGNKKAVVGERIGITDITIHYDRPGVKGREGQIWGKLVHTGYADLGFGTSKAAPWRAGANENTTIEFSTDVKVEGQDLPAGTYAFFVAWDANECTLIFSKNAGSWGSFFYDPKEDALQVKVKPVSMDKNVEWLKYEFLNQAGYSATVALEWEKIMIPFKVEVDYVKTQLESFRRELRSNKGFTWNAWVQAAQFCINHKTNLDEALVWADKSVNEPFIGEKNFTTLSAKSQVLDLLGRQEEAAAIMKEAVPLGKMVELHGYARGLLQGKKSKEAFDVFQINYNKFPDQFTTNVGMARGYSAIGNYKKSLEFAQKAFAQAPDPQNKANMEKAIKTLQNGKDFNQM